MILEIKIELNTDNGRGDLEINLEKGVSPKDIDFDKVAKQVSHLFELHGPLINQKQIEIVQRKKLEAS